VATGQDPGDVSSLEDPEVLTDIAVSLGHGV
jgi:hypothetical protein